MLAPCNPSGLLREGASGRHTRALSTSSCPYLRCNACSYGTYGFKDFSEFDAMRELAKELLDDAVNQAALDDLYGELSYTCRAHVRRTHVRHVPVRQVVVHVPYVVFASGVSCPLEQGAWQHRRSARVVRQYDAAGCPERAMYRRCRQLAPGFLTCNGAVRPEQLLYSSFDCRHVSLADSIDTDDPELKKKPWNPYK